MQDKNKHSMVAVYVLDERDFEQKKPLTTTPSSSLTTSTNNTPAKIQRVGSTHNLANWVEIFQNLRQQTANKQDEFLWAVSTNSQYKTLEINDPDKNIVRISINTYLCACPAYHQVTNQAVQAEKNLNADFIFIFYNPEPMENNSNLKAILKALSETNIPIFIIPYFISNNTSISNLNNPQEYRLDKAQGIDVSKIKFNSLKLNIGKNSNTENKIEVYSTNHSCEINKKNGKNLIELIKLAEKKCHELKNPPVRQLSTAEKFFGSCVRFWTCNRIQLGNNNHNETHSTSSSLFTPRTPGGDGNAQ